VRLKRHFNLCFEPKKIEIGEVENYFILKIEINKEKIRYILQYHYDKGKNVVQACEKICAIYGEDTLSKSAAQKWFVRFRAGNFNIKDKPRSGRPITEKSDEIIIKVERDKHVSTVELARELGIDHKTVFIYTKLDKKKLDVWVPPELSVRNIMDRINICDTLKRNEIEPFLKRMITGDEKWITYDNSTRKRSWIKKGEKAQAIAKPGLTRKKVMLCGGTGRESFIMSCSRPIKQLIPNSTVNNCRDYNKQLRGSGQN